MGVVITLVCGMQHQHWLSSFPHPFCACLPGLHFLLPSAPTTHRFSLPLHPVNTSHTTCADLSTCCVVTKDCWNKLFVPVDTSKVAHGDVNLDIRDFLAVS